MSVIDYEIIFIGLSHHATMLIASEEESVTRFIDGLHHDICLTMAREA